ncbi:MAG: amidohydrolase family protein [Acidobacteriota bacterium]|nr:amidohydrolase family protein [Acidobacteriota bacterium]
MRTRILGLMLAGCALASVGVTARQKAQSQRPAVPRSMREVNEAARPTTIKTTAIVGAMLIDGRGGAPVADAVVVVRGEKIIAAGSRASTPVPKDAEVIKAKGLSLLPGLIDSHFHLDGDEGLPAVYLSHGVTSVRDPGAWIEAYDAVRKSGQLIPRLFLAGPHLDNAPPAYPQDAVVVRDAEETRLAVNRFVDQGASVIKVYFRLPLGLIRTVTETAHARGVPVTAHLEIVNAADAIRAGVDGIEHITSFGTALLPLREAEKYRQSVLADNNARREGRYKVWSEIDLASPRVGLLLELIVRRGTFLSPTLAVFEKQPSDAGATEIHVRAFGQMLKFVGMAKRAGGRIVTGSHSSVPHAERGWAYQRELELLVASGLTPMEAIVAGTMENARFFRIVDRLGTIEADKLADLILIDGDPLKDMAAMRRVKRVMLNGQWVG